MINTYPTLYKNTKTGAVQIWYMEQDNDKFRTISGQQDGKKVISAWTTAEATNVGRLNERNPEQQAKFEIDALYIKKLEKDYHDSLDNIEEGSHIFEPMLAYEYKKALEKGKMSYPVYVQVKLDGQRCVIKADGMWSRNGKPIVSCPHIFKQFEDTFKKYPYLIFDGELYTHSLRTNFNKMMSLVKTIKPTEEDFIETEKFVEYHAYDITGVGDQVGFANRLIHLEKHLPKSNNIILVKTSLALNQDHLDKLYEEYLTNEYEGQIIRQDSVYEHKRSWGLLKRKEFFDAEYELVDIEEGLGNWSGKAKRAILKLPDGRTFGAGITGTMEFCENVLKNKNKYIGKMTTVNYTNLTPDGIPRFPRVKQLDRIDI